MKNVRRKTIITVCLTVFFFGSLLFSQELGRLSLTYQNQTTKKTTGSGFYTNHNFFLNLWQDMEYLGNFHFSLGYSLSGSQGKIGYYNFGLRDFALGPLKVSASAGYTAFVLTSLPSFGSFHPSSHLSFKGGSLSIASKNVSFQFFSGRTLDYSWWNEGKTEIGRVYGFKGLFQIAQLWTIGVGYLKTSGLRSDDDPSKRSDADIIFADQSFRVAKNFYVLGSFNYALKPTSGNPEFSAKVGPYIRQKYFALQCYYQYGTPRFPTINSMFSRDQKAYTAIGEFYPFRQLSFYASVDGSNDNLERILQRPLNEYLTYLYGGQINLPPLPAFSFRLGQTKRRLEKAGMMSADDKYDSLFISADKTFSGLSLSGRYSFIRSKSLNALHDSGITNYSLTIRLNIASDNDLFLNGYFIDQKSPTGFFWKNNINLQGGFMIRPSQSIMLNGDVFYYREQEKVLQKKYSGLGSGLGILYACNPLNLNISLRYQYSAYNQSSANVFSNPSHHQISLSLTKNFLWGKRSPAHPIRTVADLFRGSGEVQGFVFVDANQNGSFDKGETVFPDIDIAVDGRITAQTDDNGRYKIAAVDQGLHEISVDPRKVPAGYHLSEEGTKKIVIKKKTKNHLNFPLIPEAAISGKIILDQNKNEKADESEPGLRDIRISLSRNKEVILEDRSNLKGEFRFDGLFPGEYEIKVILEVSDGEEEAGEGNGIERGGGTDGVNGGNGTDGSSGNNGAKGGFLLRDGKRIQKNGRSSMRLLLKPGQEIRNLVLLVIPLEKKAEKRIFGVYPNSITGVVADDANLNGWRDPGEKGVSGIPISLVGNSDDVKLDVIRALTDNEGRFTFENLLAGEYYLFLEQNYLPENSRLINPVSIRIMLKKMEIIKGQDFLIHLGGGRKNESLKTDRR